MSEQPAPFPMKCSATGPGLGGGAAGVEAQFTITSADEDGRRIRAGGARVQISVLRVGLHATGGDAIPTRVVDNGDGTYTCGYAVDGRGDYSVSVELNGAPIAGSPYPVFFSGIPAASRPSAVPVPGVVPGAVPQSGAAPADVPSPAQTPELNPEDAASVSTQVHVGNLTHNVTTTQLAQLFSHCGEVRGARIAHGKQFGFVEMATPEQAKTALGLNGMALDGRILRVEACNSVRKTAPPGVYAPVGSSNGLPNPGPADASGTFLRPTAAQLAESPAEVAARAHRERLAKAAMLQANLNAQRAAEMAAARAAQISKRISGGGEGTGDGDEKTAPSLEGDAGNGDEKSAPGDDDGDAVGANAGEYGRGRSASRSRTLSPSRDGASSPPKRRGRTRSRSRSRSRDRDASRDRGRNRYKPYGRGRRRGGKNRGGAPRKMNPNGIGQE